MAQHQQSDQEVVLMLIKEYLHQHLLPNNFREYLISLEITTTTQLLQPDTRTITVQDTNPTAQVTQPASQV
jgi:hypothetical protein